MSFITPIRLQTLLFAAVGAALFLYFGFPLPLLLGPMAACLLAAGTGRQLQGFGVFSKLMRTVLGLTAGTAFTPELFEQIPRMATSLMFIPLFIIVIGCVGYPLFRFIFKFDHATSYYSAMPGGLQDMLVFGEEAGGKVRIMSLIHATRVVIIVTIAPLIMGVLWQVDLSATPGSSASETGYDQMALLAFASVFGWWAAAKLKMFGASLLGPLIVTALLTLTGFITHRPPVELIWAAQFFIGMEVGTKYLGITWKEVRDVVFAGVVYAVILAGISFAFLIALEEVVHGPPMETFLAFLPGGQGEMVLIAFIAGADMAFVVTHHILRLFVVLTLAPVVGKFVTPRE